ncbi:MAG: 50S ribosomal protein L39e [Candidatus Micrarchaeota archaeon]
MSRNKSEKRKKKLVKAGKQNRRIPVFAIAKTNRKLTFNRFSRNWRTKKLKMKERPYGGRA